MKFSQHLIKYLNYRDRLNATGEDAVRSAGESVRIQDEMSKELEAMDKLIDRSLKIPDYLIGSGVPAGE